ncbi:ABC transporter substrate-binding protein [Defluviimonas sp. WL0002]|uniref:ABC transporter substrate-binding protein n=1 Tax=Albidovulum marisflavi TaxID=2984159 RepID=A0ABT2ZG64_9RHOB|nr:ABC transporter substrate-binding protein [Defluviimonas sp. WL0002]MCV2870094.1 ABC transporter substrate-binding protein [Defluviimonas sp. WL0002]
MKTLFACAIAAGTLLVSPAWAQELIFAPGVDGRFSWESYESFGASHRLENQALTIFGPWRGQDQTLAENVFAYFAAATGAKVSYASSENYEQQIVIDTHAGSPPDIAILPQPGLLSDLALKGFLTPLGTETETWLRENYAAGDSWAQLGTYANADGERALYAFPYKAELKSLIWYVPENFEDAGYEVPESMEELKALSQRIVADGATPWCIGLGSGGATGWPATDWVEDILLRTQPPEVYDQWISNAIPFDDPAVVQAIEEFGWFALNKDFVLGGSAAVAASDFRDSPAGLFTSPPQCYMHRQASFIPSFFPKNTRLGLDADFFYFPAYADSGLGTPVLGSGTLVSITRDGMAARAFIDWLKTPIAHELWMAQAGFLTPYKAANTDAYANGELKKQADILMNATTFRFDASDLMPGRIGAGAFWGAMIDFVGGKPAAEVARAVQSAWNELG